MKKFNFLRLALLSAICCFGVTVHAEDAADFTTFDNLFTSMKGGTGGTINLTKNITIPITANQTYSLSSTSSAAIAINVNNYAITAEGTDVTADNAILEIGDNVTINGTSTIIKNSKKAIIQINGGEIKSTVLGTANSAAVVNASAGWVYVNGGKITMDASAITSGNAFTVYVNNSYPLVVTGGTLEGIGDNVRVVRISNSTATISGATILATATGTITNGKIFALLALGTNLMTIGDNTTITTTGDNAYGLVTGAATAAIAISSDVENVAINSQNPYYKDNNISSVIFDLNNLALEAEPSSGSPIEEMTQEVTFTVTGANANFATSAFYDYGVSPTTSSTALTISNNTFKIEVTPETPSVKIRFGKGSWIDTKDFEFTYDFSTTGMQEDEVSVGTFVPTIVEDALVLNKLVESVVIFDLNGRTVKTGYNISNVNVSDLTKGIYIVKITDNNTNSISKVVKK